MWSRKNKITISWKLGTYLSCFSVMFFFGGEEACQCFCTFSVSVLLCFPLSKIQFYLLASCDPCAEQEKPGESVAVNRMFLHFQTSGTSFSADCNFLLVSLISSPNALAANGDPLCSFFSLRIDTLSALTTNSCRPNCPAPLSLFSLAHLSTWGLVLRSRKPSDNRAIFMCSLLNARVQLDPEQGHLWVKSYLRAWIVSVAFICTKDSSGNSPAFLWVLWCSCRITFKWSSFSHFLGTLTQLECRDQHVLCNFHSDLLLLKQIKSCWTLLSHMPSCCWLTLWAAINFRRTVLCWSSTDLTQLFFFPSVFKPVHTIPSQHGH